MTTDTDQPAPLSADELAKLREAAKILDRASPYGWIETCAPEQPRDQPLRGRVDLAMPGYDRRADDAGALVLTMVSRLLAQAESAAALRAELEARTIRVTEGRIERPPWEGYPEYEPGADDDR